MLKSEDWVKHATAVRKLANDVVGRVWRAEQRCRIPPEDRALLLKVCLLAIASPAKPYGLSWLHESLDAVSVAKRTREGLKKPAAYLHRVLGKAAAKCGRDWHADLAALERVIPEDAIQARSEK